MKGAIRNSTKEMRIPIKWVLALLPELSQKKSSGSWVLMKERVADPIAINNP